DRGRADGPDARRPVRAPDGHALRSGGDRAGGASRRCRRGRGRGMRQRQRDSLERALGEDRPPARRHRLLLVPPPQGDEHGRRRHDHDGQRGLGRTLPAAATARDERARHRPARRQHGDLRVVSRARIQLPDDRHPGGRRPGAAEAPARNRRRAAGARRALPGAAGRRAWPDAAARARLGTQQLAELLRAAAAWMRSAPRHAADARGRCGDPSRRHVQPSRATVCLGALRQPAGAIGRRAGSLHHSSALSADDGAGAVAGGGVAEAGMRCPVRLAPATRRAAEGRSMSDDRAQRQVWPGRLIGIVISAICIGLLARQVDLVQAFHDLARLNGYVLLFPLTVFLIAIPLRALRWNAIFPLESRPGVPSCLTALGIGNMTNLLLPWRAGDVARCVLVGRGSSLADVSRTLATLGVEKALDGLALVGMILLTISSLSPPPWMVKLVWAGGLLFGGALLIMVFLRYRAASLIDVGIAALRRAHLA